MHKHELIFSLHIGSSPETIKETESKLRNYFAIIRKTLCYRNVSSQFWFSAAEDFIDFSPKCCLRFTCLFCNFASIRNNFECFVLWN